MRWGKGNPSLTSLYQREIMIVHPVYFAFTQSVPPPPFEKGGGIFLARAAGWEKIATRSNLLCDYGWGVIAIMVIIPLDGPQYQKTRYAAGAFCWA